MAHAVKSCVFYMVCAGLSQGAPLAAETVSYSGKVVDGAGNAIPWAFIKVQGSDLIGQSGADGAFSITTSVTTRLYGDPRPRSPFQVSSASGAASDAAPATRFLLTGRAASGSHLAAAWMLTARGGTGAAPSPPAPPALEKTGAAAFTLTVNMARYQPGSFPQPTVTAKNLVLTLVPSATDTAAYAAEKKLCLDTLNAYRATLSLKPVVWSSSLEAFADQGARYDSERDDAHAHFGAFSLGAVPSDAENAIPGWPLKNYKTVAKIVGEGAKMMWAEGPGGGHYENIKGNHAAVGCGIYVNPAGGVWVIHNFK